MTSSKSTEEINLNGQGRSDAKYCIRVNSNYGFSCYNFDGPGHAYELHRVNAYLVEKIDFVEVKYHCTILEKEILVKRLLGEHIHQYLYDLLKFIQSKQGN